MGQTSQELCLDRRAAFAEGTSGAIAKASEMAHTNIPAAAIALQTVIFQVPSRLLRAPGRLVRLIGGLTGERPGAVALAEETQSSRGSSKTALVRNSTRPRTRPGQV